MCELTGVPCPADRCVFHISRDPDVAEIARRIRTEVSLEDQEAREKLRPKIPKTLTAEQDDIVRSLSHSINFTILQIDPIMIPILPVC
jgi:hypothetical protein